MHLSIRSAALAAAIVLGSGGPAVHAAAPPPEVFPDSPITELLAAEVGATRGTVQRLTVDARPGAPVRFAAVLDGETVELDLVPWSGRAEDCRLIVVRDGGVVEEMELPPPRTWRGSVVGDPSRSVAATIDAENRVFATIRDEVDGRSWGLQPATGPGGVFEGWSVAYDRADVMPTGGVCGNAADDADMIGVRAMPRAIPRADEPIDPLKLGVPERLDVGFAADFEYFQARGGSINATVQDIETVMNSVGLNYQTQLGISFRTTGFLVWTTVNDPYSSTNSIIRLCEFRENWNGINWFPKDTAHLFTGVDLDGDIIGRAYEAALCNPDAPGCGGGSLSYGLSQSTFSTNMTDRVILTMHELGHNWGACHCSDSACTGGGADPDCGVMSASVNNATMTFGSRSVFTIQTYRATLGCLTPAFNPVYVDAAYSGLELGTIVLPFNTFLEGYWAVPVGGTVSFDPGVYPQNVTMVRPMVLERTGGGTVVLGQ
jgi:hypothetical protein